MRAGLSTLYTGSTLFSLVVMYAKEMIAKFLHTSSVTNEWAMAKVIKHPQVLLNIQNELDSVVGRNRMVTESDLPHLNYLRRADSRNILNASS
ncbi:hypothetical protein IFM89_002854 [Coptis chinensis]|uniref:Uncharacterized protein n=1 Tax=Coptis chinensis TaxID=261450 RepID=A0A835H2T1_9MAGN|nr:hypothetical protein IFM89_002854 [Coptis chinensis]